MSQQLPPNTVLPYCIPKGMTHLMMWFGSSLPEARYVGNWQKGTHTYEVGKDEKGGIYVNYIQTLREECKKMSEKGEACIFVYDSRFLSSPDKQQLQDIVSSISNCYLVDYKEFVEKVRQEPDIEYNKQPVQRKWFDGSTYTKTFKKNKQSDFISDIEDLIKSNVKKQIFEGSLKKNSMANIVDCARMLLLHHPSKLKQLAINSNCKKDVELNPDDCSLLYHDFDMIQQTQPDIQHTQKQLTGKKNIELDKNKSYLVFQKNIHCITAWGIENSLILAISPNDKNERIDNIWCWYINPNVLDGEPLFDVLGRDNEIKLMEMDVRSHWKDEKHGSWKYKPRNPQHIVNRNTQNTENQQGTNKNSKEVKKNNEVIKETTKRDNKNNTNNKTINKNKIIKSTIDNKHTKKEVKAWLKDKKLERIKEQKKTKELSKKMRKYKDNLIDSKRCIDIQNPYTNYKPVYADISNRTSSYHCHFPKGGKKMFPQRY